MKEPYVNAHNTNKRQPFLITDDDVLVCLCYAQRRFLPVFDSGAAMFSAVNSAIIVTDITLDRIKKNV